MGSKQAAQAHEGKWGETPIRLAQIMRPRKEDSPELVLLKQALEGISDIAATMKTQEIIRSRDRSFCEWFSKGPDRLVSLKALADPSKFGYQLDDLPTARTDDLPAVRTEKKNKK
jgi:hypothetical protein